MRPSTRRWLYALLGVALLSGGAAMVPELDHRREAAGLFVPPPPKTEQPADRMLGPLLAIGRAPLVDYLWMRASKLKEEGRYFDAYQLAEFIGRLQPRFSAVWIFNAWNMAYNISVTLRLPEERWRWVWNGIVLLRDQGIPRNPRGVTMYKELAWIFFHKIGDYMDDMHLYYKLQLALLMEDILGRGPNADYAGLAAAPTEWTALIADADVATVVETFRRELKQDLSVPGVYLGLLNNPDPSRELTALLNDPATADVRHRIEMYWRARRLRDEAKLDPQRMLELRNAYGPFDFRTAEANAMYWSSLGTSVALGNRLALDIDKLNTDRITFYCLQSLFRRGRLVMPLRSDGSEPPMLLPDVRFADAMRRTIIAISDQYPKQPGQGPVHENFRPAFVNFMREAILRFNEAGDLKKSHEYFEDLAKHYPDDYNDKGYDRFISKMWLDVQDFTQLRDVQNRMLSVLATAVQLIGYGQPDEAATYVAFARRMHTLYEKSQNNDRYRLKPFNDMFEYVVHEMGQRMAPDAYERVLKATGFKPQTTQRAAGASPE
jgi:hypothetical protein